MVALDLQMYSLCAAGTGSDFCRNKFLLGDSSFRGNNKMEFKIKSSDLFKDVIPNGIFLALLQREYRTYLDQSILWLLALFQASVLLSHFPKTR